MVLNLVEKMPFQYSESSSIQKTIHPHSKKFHSRSFSLHILNWLDSVKRFSNIITTRCVFVCSNRYFWAHSYIYIDYAVRLMHRLSSSKSILFNLFVNTSVLKVRSITDRYASVLYLDTIIHLSSISEFVSASDFFSSICNFQIRNKIKFEIDCCDVVDIKETPYLIEFNLWTNLSVRFSYFNHINAFRYGKIKQQIVLFKNSLIYRSGFLLIFSCIWIILTYPWIEYILVVRTTVGFL